MRQQEILGDARRIRRIGPAVGFMVEYGHLRLGIKLQRQTQLLVILPSFWCPDVILTFEFFIEVALTEMALHAGTR
jgi:hypothetical protein